MKIRLPKKQFWLILMGLSLTSSVSFSQSFWNKLSLTPHVNIGMALPGQITSDSSLPGMEYEWLVGRKTLNGNQKLTGRIGLNLEYALNDKLFLYLGFNKTTLVRSYVYSGFGIASDKELYSQGTYLTYFDNSIGVGFRKNKWIIKVEPSYTYPLFTPFQIADVGNKSIIYYFNANDTGFGVEEAAYANPRFNIRLGISREFEFLSTPWRLNLTGDVSMTPFFKQNILSFDKSIYLGEQVIPYKTNGIFIGISKPIGLGFLSDYALVKKKD